MNCQYKIDSVNYCEHTAKHYYLFYSDDVGYYVHARCRIHDFDRKIVLAKLSYREAIVWDTMTA
jgi:hypothetical protein